MTGRDYRQTDNRLPIGNLAEITDRQTDKKDRLANGKTDNSRQTESLVDMLNKMTLLVLFPILI